MKRERRLWTRNASRYVQSSVPAGGLALRALAPAVVFLCFSAALAQNPRQSNLEGTVRDADGAALADVTVTAASASTGAPQARTVSGADGRYRLFALAPSDDYVVTAERQGLAAAEIGRVTLDPGGTTTLDLTLFPSAEAGREKEPGRGSIVDVSRTKTARVFHDELFDGLPIVGRRYQDLLVLVPGADDTDRDGTPVVHGARDTSFQTRLDGFDLTDPVTGRAAQSISLEAIGELEAVTAGFPAAWGGAAGGYGNILSRSGTNRLGGALKFFYRSDLLDGDGANNNDVSQADRLEDFEGYDDLRASLAIGGPLVPDRAWFFLAAEWIDVSVPVSTLGDTLESSETGWNNFLKFSFQLAPRHRLSLSGLWDPREIDGLGRGVALSESPDLLTGVGPVYAISDRSGFGAEQEGRSVNATWRWDVSPRLVLDTMVAYLERSVDLEPTADPQPCPLDAFGRCNPFREDLYTFDLVNGSIRGPYPTTSRDDRRRGSLRFDASYFVEGRGGSHSVAGGVELGGTEFEQSLRQDRVRWENIVPSGGGGIGGQIGFLDWFPPSQQVEARGRDVGLYLQDTYRPVPSVAIHLGLRWDRDESTFDGWGPFDPAAEAERFTRLYEIGNNLPPGSASITTALAGNADIRYDINGDGKDNLHCKTYDLDGTAFGDGMPDGIQDDFCLFHDDNGDGDLDDPFDLCLGPCCGDPDAAPFPDFSPDGSFFNPQCDQRSDDVFFLLSAFTRHQLDATGEPFDSIPILVPDRDGDGIPAHCPAFPNPSFPDWVPGVDCTAGELLDADDLAGTTRAEEEEVEIVHESFSPRIGVSWDPWADNRTRFFATWGRYHDRVPLGALIPEQGPDGRTTVYGASSITQGSAAVPIATGQFSVWQVDRDLEAPRTEEWTVGFERELAPDWSVGLTYVNRTGKDQLQDVEVNHYMEDAAPADGVLDDNFGRIVFFGGGSAQAPDGLPDLFVYNPLFDQVFVVGNFNSSEYEAAELVLRRRLGRRWQTELSYVWAEARSDGDATFSSAGDDPAAAPQEFSFSDSDRTHTVKWYGVVHLPAAQQFGWSVDWASGDPYSVVTLRNSCDSQGNCALRQRYETGLRNDQRNEGAWDIDLRYRKDFHFSRYALGVSVEVANLLNDDDLRITSSQPNTVFGITGERDFGRRWQLGAEFHF